MDETTSFGAWLSHRRKALDLTQAELARQLGCATVTLQKIELDEERPSKDMAERLAEALEIPPTERSGFLRSARGELAVDRLAVEAVSREAPQAPWAPTSRAQHNLPVQRDPLIGREREVSEVVAFVRRPDVGLVTLTGPGGSGKTRLSLQAAAELLEDFADGVWVVELAFLSDPALLTSTIAQTLGIPPVGDQPLLERLKSYVHDKQLLLVLDNFEHVIVAAPIVTALLQAAPCLKVLVSSREVLRLSGERDYPVPPLALPNLQQREPLDRLGQYAAVALFIQRAQASQPDFRVTHENALAVAEICVRLDGLPLALELAAARVKVLPPAMLLTRLSNRLQVLTGGARDLPARQQTLRGAIDWSYTMLEAGEQQLFRHMGVFVGGSTMEAIEAVCTAAGNLALDVLDGVASLVDKSLVRQQAGPDGAARYTMLETIREYALERLETDDEADAIRRRHADYYTDRIEAGLPDLYFTITSGTHDVAWLEQVAAEHDNLRGALHWAVQRGEVERGLYLGTALWRFWAPRGYASEGRRWLAAALALPWPDATPGAAALRARALYAAAILAGHQSDVLQYIALLTESLALFREAGDRRGSAWALLEQGRSTFLVAEEMRAGALYEESLTLFREVGDSEGLCLALTELIRSARRQGNHSRAQFLLAEGEALLGQLVDKRVRALALLEVGDVIAGGGDFARARGLLVESLGLHREAGNRARLADTLLYIGITARDHGDYRWAAALLEESLSLLRGLGEKGALAATLHNLAETLLLQGDDRQVVGLERESLTLYLEMGNPVDSAWPRTNLGYIAQHAGDYAQARAFHTESLQILREANFIWGIATSLAGLAGVATGQQHAVRAARLFGAAERLHEAASQPPSYFHGIEIGHNIAAVRLQLEATAFAAAWVEGRAMTLEQVIAYALAIDEQATNGEESR